MWYPINKLEITGDGYISMRKAGNIMNKLENLVDVAKLNEMLNEKVEKVLHKKEEEEQKKCNVLLWVLAIIGIVAAGAAIGYAVYRFFKPDYLDDFEDEFEDDFEDDEEDEDDFFEDEGEN